MGYYINQDSRGLPIGSSAAEKTRSLVADGATIISGNEFVPNMVCVINNGAFGAAGYCFDEQEYKNFNHPTDNRTKVWLQYEHAKDLAN
jgi:hypothetical protein